jgi:hypothetical protein
VHAFEFRGGVTLEVRHLRRDTYKRMCAEVDAYVDGEFIYNADFLLSEQHKRIDFAAGARAQRRDVPWEACLIQIVKPLRDVLNAARDVPRKCKRTARTPTEPEPPDAPRLDAGRKDLAALAAEAWRALGVYNAKPTLFRRGGVLMRLTHDPLRTEALTPDRLRYALGRAAAWYKTVTRGEHEVRVPALVPTRLVRDMLAHPSPPLPTLTRITRVPAFARDGSLHTAPGYHAGGQTYYHSPDGLVVPPVSRTPSDDEMAQAKAMLNGIMRDFPFVSQSDRAHAVAYFLLHFARDLIDGPTPNHLFEAPTPGTGKGLLAEVLTAPASGGEHGLISELESDEEWRKTITTLRHESRAVIWIDNVKSKLDSGTLAKALTAPTHEDRLLGGKTSVSLPVRCVWLTTGNNVSMSDEMTRRTIRIRLDAHVDRPWRREGFTVKDLPRYVREHRGELIWAALTLIQHWMAQGKPVPHVKPLGSYESWSVVIGGILESAHIAGFLEDMEDFYARLTRTLRPPENLCRRGGKCTKTGQWAPRNCSNLRRVSTVLS